MDQTVQNDQPANEPTEGQASEPALEPNVEEPQADVTGQPEAPKSEPKPEPDINANIGRKAKAYADALKAIGIDPESDMVDHIAAGIITKEDLIRQASPQAQPTQELSRKERVARIVEKAKTEGLTAEDVAVLGSAFIELETEKEHAYQTTQAQQALAQCQGVCANVIESDPMFGNAPENIQQLAKEVFFASTDAYVANRVPQGQDASKFLNARTYAYYAKENLPRFKELLGWMAAKNTETAPAAPAIKPAGAADGGSVVVKPTAPMNFKKVSVVDALADYARQSQPVT